MTYPNGNKPIVKLNLPPLPKDIEEKLFECAKHKDKFRYSHDTLGAKKDLAAKRGLKRIVQQVDKVQEIYGFDYIPTHKAARLQSPMSEEMRQYVPIDLPEETDFVVQVIDTENTFIHYDCSRKVSLYYMMVEDPTAITRFYTTNAKPVLDSTYYPEDCEEFYSIHMERGCWYMFDHQSIHAVTNVSQERVGFLVDLSRVYTYEECYEKYKDIIND